MTDVFLSYAHEDVAVARALEAELVSFGWSVWRDDRVNVAEAFDDAIEVALDRASCVVVIWSSSSARSQWVRAEAATANAQGKLVPVAFQQDVVVPTLFRQMKVAVLSSPRLNPAEESAGAFIAAVAHRTGKTPDGLDGLTPPERPPAALGVQAVSAGGWELRAANRRSRILWGNTNLRLLPDGSAVGDNILRSNRPWKPIEASHKYAGRWRFDIGSQSLYLELTGLGASLEQMHAMTAVRVTVSSWEHADRARCTVDGRGSWTLERRFGV